jgi:heat shock protein HtpX
MYSEITANKRRSFILVALFSAIVIGLGWVFGAQAGEDGGTMGIILAVIICVIMNLIGYYKGDSVALMTSGAKPLEKSQNPELYNLVENLAITDGLPTPKIYIIDDASPNAFATGRDPQHASITVSSGLLKIMNKQELEGVLAHEMSHIKNFDIRLMTMVVVLVGTIMLLSDVLIRSLGRRRGNSDNGQLQLILFLIGLALALLSPFIAELLKLAVGRQREYLADASGALLTRYPEGLALALEKIAKIDQPMTRANHATAHLFIANPFDPFVTKKFEHFFSTHPPIQERIARLRKMGI